MSKGKVRQQAIDKIIRAEEDWEPVGPTPMPDITDLRNWDKRLMETYKPFYAPNSDICNWCTFGNCDLTAGKKGACGIDISGNQARQFFQQTLAGLSAHAAHGVHLVGFLIENHGEDFEIDLGEGVTLEAPVIRNVLGLNPGPSEISNVH